MRERLQMYNVAEFALHGSDHGNNWSQCRIPVDYVFADDANQLPSIPISRPAAIRHPTRCGSRHIFDRSPSVIGAIWWHADWVNSWERAEIYDLVVRPKHPIRSNSFPRCPERSSYNTPVGNPHFITSNLVSYVVSYQVHLTILIFTWSSMFSTLGT